MMTATNNNEQLEYPSNRHVHETSYLLTSEHDRCPTFNNEYLSTTKDNENYLETLTMETNATYEKVRPLTLPTKIDDQHMYQDDHAHGDDTSSSTLTNEQKQELLSTYDNQPAILEEYSSGTTIDNINPSSFEPFDVNRLTLSSSSSDEFSLETPIDTIDASNEPLKIDNKYDMTKTSLSLAHVDYRFTGNNNCLLHMKM
jgi:hypothetical protein